MTTTLTIFSARMGWFPIQLKHACFSRVAAYFCLVLSLPSLLGAAETNRTGSIPKVEVRQGPQLADPHPLGVGRLVPALKLQGRDQRTYSLRDSRPRIATVIAFTSTSCPVSRRYLPTLARLEREFAPRGVDFVYVNPISTDTAESIETTVRSSGLKGVYVEDRDLRIAKALGARSTAEVFIVDAAGTLQFRGALDDQYGLGYSLDAPRQTFVVTALEALAVGSWPAIAATTAPGCALETASVVPASRESVTYHNRISRLLQAHCTECHHNGGSAPFALESYADVAAHAGMIRKVVEGGLMPPWFAAPAAHGTGVRWANDRSLDDSERTDLLQWLASGRPEGVATDAPLPRAYPKDWEIGIPDVVYQIPAPITVKATGRMPYQDVFVETNLEEDRWVQALEVRPTARDVVHHVLVFVVPPDPGATNGEPRRRRSARNEAGNFFAVYVPGNNVLRYPPELAKYLPKGSTLQFQIHYTPKGVETQDQTRLGLVFAKAPPKHEVRVAAIAPPRLRIPPGAANHEIPATLPVPFDARLLSFMPHMHLRGKAYRYELEDPSGRRTVLLDVPRYDFNWQIQYRLAEPMAAVAGSRLHGTAWFDNSTGNPANPDPGREVGWGIQTEDEMALGYLEFFVPSIPAGTPMPNAGGSRRSQGGVFDTLDRNRDGFISTEESPTPEAFKLADVDGDGKVTREELRAFLRRQRGR